MAPSESKDVVDLIVSGGLGLAALAYLGRLIERLIRSIENYANLERTEIAQVLKEQSIKLDKIIIAQERTIIALVRKTGVRDVSDSKFTNE
ncbi:MAG: hypothetical protein VKK42_25950 [Lyngbya sp.]|nr:hypothetical protein [Lyngbya sp.]